MKTTSILVSILAMLLLGAASFSAAAADLQRGKQLHEENCMHCHIAIMGDDGNTIYTRDDRLIYSLPDLIQQVNRCKTSLDIPWPDDQIADVVAYLNGNFYKFAE